jgi:hypothetical protein
MYFADKCTNNLLIFYHNIVNLNDVLEVLKVPTKQMWVGFHCALSYHHKCTTYVTCMKIHKTCISIRMFIYFLKVNINKQLYHYHLNIVTCTLTHSVLLKKCVSGGSVRT